MKKLYRVVCRGMQATHGTAYVVAADAEQAYQTVRADLDKRALGFIKDRELERVELLATDTEYPACERRLYSAWKPTGAEA